VTAAVIRRAFPVPDQQQISDTVGQGTTRRSLTGPQPHVPFFCCRARQAISFLQMNRPGLKSFDTFILLTVLVPRPAASYLPFCFLLPRVRRFAAVLRHLLEQNLLRLSSAMYCFPQTSHRFW